MMATIGIYFTDDEAEWVKAHQKGAVRNLVRDRMMLGDKVPEGTEPRLVYLSAEEAEYVRDREEKNGPGWFGRVARINMKARDVGQAPFYWMRPEGMEES